MKEGFLIGGGLIIVGLMLQLSSGPVDWNAFRWPVNGIVLVAEAGVWLSVHRHLQGRNTRTGLCRRADHHHGTDATRDKWYVAEQHAVVLALRTHIRLYGRDSRADSPSPA